MTIHPHRPAPRTTNPLPSDVARDETAPADHVHRVTASSPELHARELGSVAALVEGQHPADPLQVSSPGLALSTSELPSDVEEMASRLATLANGDPLLMVLAAQVREGDAATQSQRVGVESRSTTAELALRERERAFEKAMRAADRRLRLLPGWLRKLVKAIVAAASAVSTVASGGAGAVALVGVILLFGAEHVGTIAQKLGMSEGAARGLSIGLQVVGAAMASVASLPALGAASTGAAAGAGASATTSATSASSAAASASGAASSATAASASAASGATSSALAEAASTISRVLGAAEGVLDGAARSGDAVFDLQHARLQARAERAEARAERESGRLDEAVEALRSAMASSNRERTRVKAITRARDEGRNAALGRRA